MDLTKSNTLQRTGQSVRQSLPFYEKISRFMENPETREFYEECMNDVTIESTLFFLWAYEQLGNEPSIHLTPDEKVGILHELVHNPKFNHKLLEKYRNGDQLYLNE